MDLVSSFVMLITSRLAARPSIYKYSVVSVSISFTVHQKLTLCRDERGLRRWVSSSFAH